MKKFLKVALIVLIALFLLAQLYPRPKPNISAGVPATDISNVHNLPAPVHDILKSSCYDCHSINTVYPWYSKIQPVAWWLGNHIDEGKSELNFSEFGTYSLRRQFRKLEEIGDEVSEGEMPLKSYTLIHTKSKLTAEQKTILIDWTNNLRDSFSKNYPPDSLVKKSR